LIDTMKNGRELGVQGRYRQLAPVAEDTFDLGGMARLTVGPAWSTMSEADHKAITDAFGRLTFSNYAKNFASFGGEQFVVDPMVKMRTKTRSSSRNWCVQPLHRAVQLSDAPGWR
jgi:phospholipid transport system substrate-binding protein